MTNERQINWVEVKQTIRTQIILLGGMIVFIWVVEIVDTLIFQGGLDTNGIRPRTIDGLRGIVFAPVLHSDFSHLMANTLPLLVLGWFVMIRSFRTFVVVTMTVIMVSGLGTWLIGPPNSIHIGASGLVFGYFGYLLLNSWFERSLASVLWAVLVFLLYGSLIWGVLPQGNGISWQGHLFGFIGGGVAAYLLAKRSLSELDYEMPEDESILRIRQEDLY